LTEFYQVLRRYLFALADYPAAATFSDTTLRTANLTGILFVFMVKPRTNPQL
jgi:hypothetical protein